MIQTQESLYTPNCIRTFTGKYIDVLNPKPEDINIIDIAHSLSQLCRFGGHTQIFHSVAQHSIDCARSVDKEYKLAGLLHDASEAYLMDIPSPIKHRLNNYIEIENRLMHVIADKYGFQYPLPDQVKKIDGLMLELEWETIVVNYDSKRLNTYSTVINAKAVFLRMFYDLIYCP